jgi:hypothetical protein
VHYLKHHQRHLYRLKLEAQNKRALVELACLLDLAAYFRPREKMNLFSRFATFADGCVVSPELRLELFRAVYRIAKEEPVIQVHIELSQDSGCGALVARGEKFFLIDGISADFHSIWNSSDFEAAFHSFTETAVRFEGQPVVKILRSRMSVIDQEGPLKIKVFHRGSSFTMASLEPNDPTFVALVKRLAPPMSVV